MSSDSVLTGTAAIAISEADVAGFAAKLEAWYVTLGPGEQALLERLLSCAEGEGAEEGEVEGYAALGLGARLSRLMAMGLLGATLAAPLVAPHAASAAGGSYTAVNTIHPIVATPQQIIQQKAAALGAAFTGPAQPSGLETVPGGYLMHYQNCDIYYTPSTGVCCELHGDIRTKYNMVGATNSSLGFPQCDVSGFGDGRGLYSVFANNSSAIATHPDTGPRVMVGTIHNAWVSMGSDTGTVGYPTTDEISLGGGAGYQDFQNHVLYHQGNQLVPPLTASLSRTQVETLMHHLLLDHNPNYSGGHIPDSLHIHSFALQGATGTGYGLQQTTNRLIIFRVTGDFDYNGIDTDFTVTVRYLFGAQKESDGSTSLRVQCVDIDGTLDGDPYDTTLVLNGVFKSYFQSPQKVIDLTVPASVRVLSFKVLADGGLTLYLQPGPANPIVQQAVQFALNRAAQ